MRRFVIWIVIGLLSLIFIGNEQSIEISDRALVHAVGIDKDDKGYTVTLQIFTSQGSGSDTQIDPSKPNTRVITNKAKTFNEAMTLCENQLGNYLFIGHNQIIVLGSDTDFSQPEELLNYFIRNRENFLGVDVVLAEKTAQEILNVQISTGAITTENFKETVKMYREKGSVIPSDMVSFLNECMKPDKSATLPIVSVKKNDQQSSQGGQQGQSGNQSQGGESGGDGQGQSGGGQSDQNTTYDIKETAVISGGKIVGKIDAEEAQCINLMTDKTDYGMITVKYKDEDLGLLLKTRKSKAKVSIENNKLVHNVEISLTAITENNTYTQEDKDNISKKVEKKLKKQCEETYAKVAGEYNADIFDLYRLVKHYEPKLYVKYQDNYELLKKNTLLQVKVNCVAK